MQDQLTCQSELVQLKRQTALKQLEFHRKFNQRNFSLRRMQNVVQQRDRQRKDQSMSFSKLAEDQQNHLRQRTRQNNDLHHKNQNLKAQTAQLKQRTIIQKRKCQNAEQKISRLNDRIKQLQIELNKTRDQLLYANNQLSDSNCRRLNLQLQFNNLKAHRQQCHCQLKAVKAQNYELRNIIQQFELLFKNHLLESRQLQSKVSSLSQQRDQLAQQAESAQNLQLLHQKLTKSHNQLKAKYKQSKKTIKTIVQEIEKLRLQVAALLNQLSQQSQLTLILQEQNQSLRRRISQLLQQRSQLQVEYDIMLRQLSQQV